MQNSKNKIYDKSYNKIIRSFKTRKKGATISDIAACTALPLSTVKNLVPVAAHEFSGRLEVTESGEILYSFPQGFTSRYRGLGHCIKRFTEKLIVFSLKMSILLFKFWIMIMLIGYFLLFMTIALASIFLSMAASSGRNSSRRGSSGNMAFSMSIFNMIMRLWFYSELTKSYNQRRDPYGRTSYAKPSMPGKPLHKAIFSFVFGDGDPNSGWEEENKRILLKYLKENCGVISLPEFMIISGLGPAEAERAITAFCVEFNGSPEATEDGTVVYCFNEILLSSEKTSKKPQGLSAASLLIYKTKETFSSNPEKMNFWFNIINAFNLVFGIYFLYSSASIGNIITEQSSYIYSLVYVFISVFFIINPLPLIPIVLGIIPLAFSLLFWLIPILRKQYLNNKNKTLNYENSRKFIFFKIWDSPLSIKKKNLEKTQSREYNIDNVIDKIIKEMGTYSMPEISLDENNNEVYSFTELEREKKALEKYQLAIDIEKFAIGETVFDSGK